MINVAILGFGVVGSGIAEVLTTNKELIKKHIGDEINIKYILDLLAFPSSFAQRIHADAPKAQGHKSFFVCKPHHPVLFLFSFRVSI